MSDDTSVDTAVIDGLQRRIGETIAPGEWVTIEQSRIDMFAEATADHQWIHVDPARAATGPFGTTIAHGFLTLSLIPRYGPDLGVDVGMGINYGLDKVRFLSPVPVGSRVRMSGVIKDVGETAGGIRVVTEVTVELEGSDRPACIADTVVLLYP